MAGTYLNKEKEMVSITKKEEFERLLMSVSSSEAVEETERRRLLELTRTERMEDFDQRNPHHCHDLLEHTLRTVRGIDTFGITEGDAMLLRVAAFFHDVGKPDVAAEKQGRLVFYGHAEQSARIAERTLDSLGYSGEEKARILFYIRNHDMFISFAVEEEMQRRERGKTVINTETVRRALRRANAEEECPREILDFIMLLRLSDADAEAQSEEVFMNGVLTDTKERKLMRVDRIRTMMMALLFQSVRIERRGRRGHEYAGMNCKPVRA